jgi:hypothetical protein
MGKKSSSQSETASAKKGRQPRKLRLIDICAKHNLSISELAKMSDLPEYIVYYMLIGQPVWRGEVTDVLTGLYNLTDIDYYHRLDVVLMPDDEPEGAEPREFDLPPCHRILLDGEIVYEGFDWDEAEKQFYHLLSTAGRKRIISHEVKAPRVPAARRAARAKAPVTQKDAQATTQPVLLTAGSLPG